MPVSVSISRAFYTQCFNADNYTRLDTLNNVIIVFMALAFDTSFAQFGHSDENHCKASELPISSCDYVIQLLKVERSMD